MGVCTCAKQRLMNRGFWFLCYFVSSLLLFHNYHFNARFQWHASQQVISTQLLFAPLPFLFLEEQWSAGFKDDSHTQNSSLTKNKPNNFLHTLMLPIHYGCTQQWWAIPSLQTHLESSTLHWLYTVMGSCSLPSPASSQCPNTPAMWHLTQGRWGSSLLPVSELQLRHHFWDSGLFHDCELLLIPAISNIWTSKQACRFSAFTWIEEQSNVIPAFRIMEPTY